MTTSGYVLSLFSKDLLVAMYIYNKLFNILHLIFLGNKLSLLFAYTHPSVFIATATANSPNTKQYSCKSVKTPFTCDVWKNTVLGVGSRANTALGFASYCICYSTPPFVLYFPYITHSGTLTYVLTM